MTRMMYFLALFMIFPAAALAEAVPHPSPTLVLPTDQLWAFAAGSVIPLMTYAINKWAPYTSEKIKGIMQVLAAAIAGGLTQAITAGGVGFNSITLQFILTAVVAALGAHKALWLPSGISRLFGGGQNAAPKAPKLPAA